MSQYCVLCQLNVLLFFDSQRTERSSKLRRVLWWLCHCNLCHLCIISTKGFLIWRRKNAQKCATVRPEVDLLTEYFISVVVKFTGEAGLGWPSEGPAGRQRTHPSEHADPELKQSLWLLLDYFPITFWLLPDCFWTTSWLCHHRALDLLSNQHWFVWTPFED